MGSKPVREAHMMRYGAPKASGATELDGQVRIEELARPKRLVSWRAPSAAAFAGRNGVAQAGSGTVDGGTNKSAKTAMEHVFPRTGFDEDSDDDDDASSPLAALSDEERQLISPPPDYPLDWRRLPTPAERESVEWVYASINLERQQTVQQAYTLATRAIHRNMQVRGALVPELPSRRDARSMLRSAKRFGVMVDIVATKRRLLTGEPHELAMQLYEFVEHTYPLTVVFAVVGITDNRVKRVARDVLNRAPVAGSKKLPFGAIDGQHMMIVHPLGHEGAAIKQVGRESEQAKADARRARTCTPKFVPDGSLFATREVASRNLLRSRESSRNALLPATKRLPGLPDCDRCWRHNRPPTAQSSMRSASRPVSPAAVDPTMTSPAATTMSIANGGGVSTASVALMDRLDSRQQQSTLGVLSRPQSRASNRGGDDALAPSSLSLGLKNRPLQVTEQPRADDMLLDIMRRLHAPRVVEQGRR